MSDNILGLTGRKCIAYWDDKIASNFYIQLTNCAAIICLLSKLVINFIFTAQKEKTSTAKLGDR